MARDPKTFWSFIKSKRKSNNGCKLMEDGRMLSQQESAEEFANFFHSIYSPEPAMLDTAAASATASANSAWVHIHELEVADVLRALQRLPPKRSVGPDGIPPFVLRDCRSVLAEPLCHVFNRSLKTATFPSQWKLSRVVPVPKGSGGSNACDYRPVAVLCAPAKVFESTIQRSLQGQVSSQLSDAQHGFRSGRSTAGNLLQLMTKVLPVVDAGGQVDVTYFDFRKAFDVVDNDILLKKLADMGCTLHTLEFFASYMQDRRQYVDCGGHRSEPYFTRSGVSQGSNLGPLQFVIMINDLPEVLRESQCLLFADDLKIVREIRDVSDCYGLQEDIDRVVQWSLENKLHFNVSKCSSISFTRSRNPVHHPYAIDGAMMERRIEVRDLGVNFKADLSFRHHITMICKKAYRILGFVLRQSRDFSNINAIRALYDSLVKSHMEFNSGIWSPHEAKYSLMLERIQNKFTRFLYLKMYGVYPFYPLMYPSLFVLGMVGYNRLEVRRELALALYIFKLLRGRINNPDVLEMVSLCVPDRYVWRRHRPRLLAEPRARTNLLREAPLTRALRTLNKVATHSDLFICSCDEFTRVALFVLCS